MVLYIKLDLRKMVPKGVQTASPECSELAVVLMCGEQYGVWENHSHFARFASVSYRVMTTRFAAELIEYLQMIYLKAFNGIWWRIYVPDY